MTDKIKDILYLDIERVRSFFAQLSKGLPMERSAGGEREYANSAGVEGGFLNIAKAFFNSDFRYAKSNSETKSLHDYMVAEFLDLLVKENRLQNVPHRDFVWKHESFTDGMFVLTSGSFVISDFQDIAAKLELWLYLVKMNPQVVIPPDSVSIIDAIKHTMGDKIKLEIKPYTTQLNQVFSCFVIRDYLRVPPAVIETYGSQIKANWHCLLQVNIGDKEEIPSQPPKQIDPNEITSGRSTLEEMVKQVAGTMIPLQAMIQGIRFPAVSAIPIIIYREV